MLISDDLKQQWLYWFIPSLYLNDHVLLHRSDISIFIIAAQSNAQLLDQR